MIKSQAICRREEICKNAFETGWADSIKLGDQMIVNAWSVEQAFSKHFPICIITI